MNIDTTNKYLVLLLSAKEYKIFLGTDNRIVKLKTHTPDHAVAYNYHAAEKVGNFTDSHGEKEVLLNKFVHHVDTELDKVLQEYSLPVFLLATERAAGHFKKLSHHKDVIAGYIHGNYDDASISEIEYVLEPYIGSLEVAKEKELENKIEKTINAGKFCYGIAKVREHSRQHRGSLLVIERDFEFEDGLDTIIQNIKDSGGTIEYADAAIISKYEHIGLIQYF